MEVCKHTIVLQSIYFKEPLYSPMLGTVVPTHGYFPSHERENTPFDKDDEIAGEILANLAIESELREKKRVQENECYDNIMRQWEKQPMLPYQNVIPREKKRKSEKYIAFTDDWEEHKPIKKRAPKKQKKERKHSDTRHANACPDHKHRHAKCPLDCPNRRSSDFADPKDQETEILAFGKGQKSSDLFIIEESF
jgi:hypothetical protein